VALVQTMAELIRGVTAAPRADVYSVSLNREATPTVSRSTLAIKADAARRLFDISCRDRTWAIIDSGIDARHPAFRLREQRDGSPVSDEAFVDKEGAATNCTRILETYDFTQIDVLLDPIRRTSRKAWESGWRPEWMPPRVSSRAASPC